MLSIFSAVFKDQDDLTFPLYSLCSICRTSVILAISNEF